MADELKGSYADSYTEDTIWGAKAYAIEFAPSVAAGKGITVHKDTYEGKITYWVGNSGVTSVDKTSSCGVALTYTDGKVGVNVTPGSVKEGDNSVVTGGAVYEAASKVAAKLPTVSQGTGIIF